MKTKCPCRCHTKKFLAQMKREKDWVRLVHCGLCGFVFWNRKHNGRRDMLVLGSWDP